MLTKFLERDLTEMDPLSIASVIKGKDLIALIALIAFAAVPLVRGAFAIRGGLHQRRKDFLELWMHREHRGDDLWLEGLVRHIFGADLPAAFIRHVISLDSPFDKLRRASLASDFLTLDPALGRVRWIKMRRAHRWWFTLECLGWGVAYLALLSFGVTGIVVAVADPLDFALIFYSSLLILIAAFMFWYLMALTDARKALRILDGGDEPFLKRPSGRKAFSRRRQVA